MKLVDEVIVPAYDARSIVAKRGQLVKIIDIEGQQVGDLLVYKLNDHKEFVTPGHTRASLKSLKLTIGDCLYTNRRAPLMKIIEDTVGVHDLLYPECDPYRYSVDFGLKEYHKNCYDNLMGELRKLGIIPEFLPEPINVFMNVPVKEDMSIVIEEPTSKAGDYIMFEALDDVIVAMSSCSNDVPGWNTNAGTVTDMKIEVYEK